MKPTKMRNSLIYRATFNVKSKQLTSPLSNELRKKYSKKSIRVVEGDSVKIVRGEFKGVDGKISEVSTEKRSVAIEGIKKEKTKGDKFDIYIHTSNLLVTGLNTEDKWRIKKLEGKSSQPKQSETPTKLETTKETKVEKTEKKEDEK